MIVGNHRCTWGPAYWCSSLSNSRECGSIEHCSTEVWSQQALEKKANDNICQYCEYTINKLRDILAENQTQVFSFDSLSFHKENLLSVGCSREMVSRCMFNVTIERINR